MGETYDTWGYNRMLIWFIDDSLHFKKITFDETCGRSEINSSAAVAEERFLVASEISMTKLLLTVFLLSIRLG